MEPPGSSRCPKLSLLWGLQWPVHLQRWFSDQFWPVHPWSCLSLLTGLPSGTSVHGIFQARIVEQVAISSSRESSWPRDWTHVSYISRWILYYCTTLEAQGLGVDRWKLESVCETIQQQGRPECSAPSCPNKGSFAEINCVLGVCWEMSCLVELPWWSCG